MIKFLTENLEWLFSGIGVTAFVMVIGLFKRKKTNDISSSSPKDGITINNNFGVNPKPETSTTSETNITSKDDERLKENTRILFIDDNHTEFKMVSILKKSGWANTKSVKDVVDLDDHKVQEADIIFVDINGVGTTMFQDQGLGLASALKKKYDNKKIVLYSAENTGDRFHKALREVDNCLPKNAEPYQFIELIESLARHR